MDKFIVKFDQFYGESMYKLNSIRKEIYDIKIKKYIEKNINFVAFDITNDKININYFCGDFLEIFTDDDVNNMLIYTIYDIVYNDLYKIFYIDKPIIKIINFLFVYIHVLGRKIIEQNIIKLCNEQDNFEKIESDIATMYIEKIMDVSEYLRKYLS